MQGSVISIILASLTVVTGVWLVSAAIIGYFARSSEVLERIAVAALGFVLLVPASIFIGGKADELFGAILNTAIGVLSNIKVFRCPATCK